MAGLFTDPRKGKRLCGRLDSLSPVLWGRASLCRSGLGPQGRSLSSKGVLGGEVIQGISSTMFSSFWTEEMDKNPSTAVCRGSGLEVSAFVRRKDGAWEMALQAAKGPVWGTSWNRPAGAEGWGGRASPSVLGEHLSPRQAGKEQSSLMKMCNRCTAPVPLAPCWSRFLIHQHSPKWALAP